MNRRALVSVALLLGLSACGGNTEASAPPTTVRVTVTATPPAATLEVLDCTEGKPSVKPRDLTITCADAGNTLSDLTWHTWSAAGATATGTAIENDCQPDCANGPDLAYPATVTLFGTYPAKDGQVLFAGLAETIGGTYATDFPDADGQPYSEQLPG